MVEISSDFDSIDALNPIKKILKRYEIKLQKIGKECKKDADRIVLEWLSTEIKKRYNDAMKEFYDAYPRQQYKPRESLLGKIEVTSDVDDGRMYFDVMDDRLVGPDRHGNNSLVTFKKIWEEGYHGGATKGDYTRIERDGKEVKIYTPHPHPGTPYYRKGPHFLSWGREAVKTTPPNDLWGKKRNELQKEAREKRRDLVIDMINKRKGEIFR